MAKQTINIGTALNAKDGDTVRDAFNKVNQNFTELYTLTGGTAAELTEIAQDYAAAMFTSGTHSGITVTYDDDNNKLNLTVPAGFSGSYNDLTDTPAIPADILDLTDTSNLLFDGDYTSLSNKPSIPPNDVDLGGTKYRLIAGDSIELVSSSANYFVRVSEGGIGLTTGTLISGPITILDAASTGIDGNITFPDNTVQTTAWTGIPGPYTDDAAAAIANVAVGSPYYQPSGQVFVRLV